jgi:sRNA-binding carbon storage regulator CsrA
VRLRVEGILNINWRPRTGWDAPEGLSILRRGVKKSIPFGENQRPSSQPRIAVVSRFLAVV